MKNTNFSNKNDRNNNNKKFDRNNNKKPAKKAIPNPTMDIPMYLGGTVGRFQYELEDLVNILKTIPFEKISYPIIAAKSAIYNDEQKTGTIQVGYINSVEFVDAHDDEMNMDYTDVIFHVSIYAKNEEAIKAIVDPIIFPKIKLSNPNAGEIGTITGLQVMTSDIPDDEWDNIR